jgi:hypothetical protein
MRSELQDALRKTREIAERRRRICDRLRVALEADDREEVVRWARHLLGMDNEEESDRSAARLNRGTGAA